MTTCPTCGKAVDPLRAPAAKVRDGKVVAYCSKEHADAAETKPTVSKRTPSVGVAIPKSAKDLDSGPIIEIIREKSEPKRTRSRDDDTDGAIEIADTGHVDDYVHADEPPRHTARIVVLVMLLLAAGGVLVAYQMGYLDKYLGRSQAAVVAPPAPPPPAMEAPREPPPVSPAAALDKAHAQLGALLKSDSPRVQRVAAAALARTADKDAIAFLAAALAPSKEDSDLAKLEIAYALARAGDKRGTDALVAALGSPRRDPKLEAGRRLALLGDKRAVPVLSEYLEVSQLRLGAAVELANVADPKALDALDKIRKDDKATPDDRARATIALGLSGRADVSDALRTLLSDARQNAFAAAALAALHDPAARPVLEKQLAVPSLRVGAARALRRLDPSYDPASVLPALLDALGSAKDTEQAQAAEAILLLAGPAAWSEHE